MKYDLKLFSKRLRTLLEKNYHTQKEIADRAGITTGNMSMYCQGKIPPSSKTLVAICIALDCSPDWLTKGKGSINDTFQMSAISILEKKIITQKISATKIDELIEIRFFVRQNDFNTFIDEARRDGCFT